MNNNELRYISVVTNQAYLDGVKVLKKSLDLVQSNYSFSVLVPQEIDPIIKQDLDASGIHYIECRPLESNVMSRPNKTSHWVDTFFKLKVFDLTQFRKIVFLDSDMIVLNNLDHLFDKPHMSCVAAGQEYHKDWIDLNSGLMVIEPNHDDYLGLVNIIDQVYQAKMDTAVGCGDQDVIEAYFSEWRNTPDLHLPGTYNTMLGYAGYLQKKGDIKNYRDIYVYHFTGKQKPWRKNIKEDLMILLKIIKRSKSLCDFQIFLKYKDLLRSIH